MKPEVLVVYLLTKAVQPFLFLPNLISHFQPIISQFTYSIICPLVPCPLCFSPRDLTIQLSRTWLHSWIQLLGVALLTKEVASQILSTVIEPVAWSWPDAWQKTHVSLKSEAQHGFLCSFFNRHLLCSLVSPALLPFLPTMHFTTSSNYMFKDQKGNE